MEKRAASYEADEPVYTVLDPRSREPEVEFRGLNPRLDTLARKRIIVANLHGGNHGIHCRGPENPHQCKRGHPVTYPRHCLLLERGIRLLSNGP
jgi:hypothetical protein